MDSPVVLNAYAYRSRKEAAAARDAVARHLQRPEHGLGFHLQLLRFDGPAYSIGILAVIFRGAAQPIVDAAPWGAGERCDRALDPRLCDQLTLHALDVANGLAAEQERAAAEGRAPRCSHRVRRGPAQQLIFDARRSGPALASRPQG